MFGGQALDMFTEIQKDEAKYERFVNNFGRYIKVGVIEDQDNKDALLKLATFSSSSSDDKRASHYPTCLLPSPLLPSSHPPPSLTRLLFGLSCRVRHSRNTSSA